MISSTRGRLIVLEGLDGAGTSTQTALLAAWLRQQGPDVVETREPTDGPFGALVRRILAGSETADPATLALAFAADRVDHVEGSSGIRAALAAGRWVVSDRYVLSSLAYQAGEGLPLDWLRQINRFAIAPDLTLFIDTKPEVCMQRIAARGDSRERFETLERLRATLVHYQACLGEAGFVGKLVPIDGNGSRDEVFAAIEHEVAAWMASA